MVLISWPTEREPHWAKSDQMKNSQNIFYIAIYFFKALTDVRALKTRTCTQNIGLEPPFTGSYIFQEFGAALMGLGS